MQNNEKLVAVNERIEEAMNYRGELKKFEVKEAERVEELRQKSADNQRKKLLLNQVSYKIIFPPLHNSYQLCVEKRNVVIGGQVGDIKTQYENLDGQRPDRASKAN